MAKKRIDKRGTRELLIRVKFLVEGATEKFYFKELLRDEGYSLHLDIDDINGGGYFAFTREITKNKSLYDIVIVIADLDRASTHIGEKEKLSDLIILLEKLNIKNNIFLTYKNIETWQVATLPYKVNDLSSELGYSGKTKGKEDIYQRLVDKGAIYTIAKTKFKESNLYYLKKELVKGIFNEENIVKTQSNLIYFLEYLKNVLEIKFHK
ncbi:hypothetical protein [Fusobacterium mortiferum]|uniref:RloB domain-containing protein n=1 Tax=Fusobacterium mortiferum TaxID=850 RepID=A0ABS2G468_FUSMR|nr:hypothetical protein [Fusobacterium mortiferum]MBM6875503.1 hypothetical protein [Fusobacterium mortiferum]